MRIPLHRRLRAEDEVLAFGPVGAIDHRAFEELMDITRQVLLVDVRPVNLATGR